MMEEWITIMLKAFFCGWAALGFGILFNVPKKNLVHAWTGGAIVGLVKFTILHFTPPFNYTRNFSGFVSTGPLYNGNSLQPPGATINICNPLHYPACSWCICLPHHGGAYKTDRPDRTGLFTNTFRNCTQWFVDTIYHYGLQHWCDYNKSSWNLLY